MNRSKEDLNRLAKWSEAWKLNLNPSKCHSFRITLKRQPIQATYKLRNTNLEHMDKVRDLGIWLDSKLTFSEHIDITVSKANKMLGLLIRSLQTGRGAGKFKEGPIITAYFGNVRSILEYGCVIWGGAAKCHLDRLERVQHKFLIWLASHIHKSRTSHSLAYHDLLKFFKICSLSQRRIQYDICFVLKIITAKFDSAYLLGSFPLHVPQRQTRGMRNNFLHVHVPRVETIKRGLFYRAVLAFNEHLTRYPEADPFNMPYSCFRASVIRYVRLHPF